MTSQENRNVHSPKAFLSWQDTLKDSSTAFALERQIDVASRSSLMPYDDGRLWIVVDDRHVMLGAVAYCLMNGTPAQFDYWHRQGWLSVYRSLQQFPGDNFRVLWLENAYVLALYPAGGHHG